MIVKAKNSEIINFIQDKLIDGKLLESGNETLYQTNNGEYKVPLYLTSSMVNELTPVLKLLTEVGGIVLFFMMKLKPVFIRKSKRKWQG